MTPHSGSRAPAIMNVSFSGVAYSFEVQPGPKGYTNFADAVRAAFNLPEDSDLNITFTCDEPCHPGDASHRHTSLDACMLYCIRCRRHGRSRNAACSAISSPCTCTGPRQTWLP